MAGFPFAGKTYVLSKALEAVQTDIAVIDPKDYREGNYDQLSEDKRREVNLTAWRCTLDLLIESIKTLPNSEVMVYDTSCASLDSMEPIFKLAKQYNHKIVYVYVNADSKIINGRGTLPIDVIAKYKENFKNSIKPLSQLANICLVINNNVEPDVSGLVQELLNGIGGVC